MKSRSEEFEEWGTEVIFGRAKGFRAAMMRMILRGASWLFRLVVLARLYLFHSSIARQARLGMLVVSVGNITVGGTGKTPVVELLARTLTRRGRKVAILTRGYKSAELDKPQEWRDKDGRLPENLPKIASDGKTRYLGPCIPEMNLSCSPKIWTAWRCWWIKTASSPASSPLSTWGATPCCWTTACNI
ncbi:tetraacyldisaccharide 4'-kinase [Akkermansia muciniphila]|uniref:tetraacyldisaccharide 4'-kinase n=1 Tax=Akkermansia muciniphila TaxID=239935 RepID=UPI002277BA0E|nr:tetraacyldisaccharide 4'-kinase [Akkermansia muciniphila]